jgi:hypothetical protein
MSRLFFILIMFSYLADAQSTDFLLLQKNNKTIASYYVGNHIALTTVTGAYIDADITAIENDTLYLKQFVVQQIPTNLGVYMLDTTGSYRFQYHYNEIKSISLSGRHFDFSASGASLLGGGAILAIASGVVYLVDRNNYSPKLMIAGLTLATAGYVMSKNSGKGIQIGKRYKLLYINASTLNK